MLLMLVACGDPVALQDYLTVVNVAPSHGAANISPDATARVTFNDDLVDESWSGRVHLLPGEGTDLVPSAVAYDSLTRTLTLTPNEPLEGDSAYVIAVTAGVEGQSFGALPAPVQTRFTTTSGGGAGPSNRPPVAVLAEPVCDAVGEPIELDGSASYDPDDDPLDLWYRVVHGPDEGELDLDVFTPTSSGEYLLGLIAFDGELESSEAFARVTCGP